MRFIGSVIEKLQRHPKRIVFPEGTEPRVLQAARQFYSLRCGVPILLGDRTLIKHAAEKLNVSLEGIRIINPAESEELDNRRTALKSALAVLNERERRIFEARRLADDPVTLEQLAEEFGVSRERVRQIEVRAFEKVQKAVKNRVAAMESPPTQPQLAMH